MMLQPPEQLFHTRTKLISAMLHALGDEQLQLAQVHLDNLISLLGLSPDHPDIVLFQAMIKIQRGNALDVLSYLNNLDPQHCPDVRVLCMYFTRNPLWERKATELAKHDPRPHVRESMALLLDWCPDELVTLRLMACAI
jgi:hypothetical protein